MRMDHFCHCTFQPSTVKLGPSGWVISIDFTSSRNCVNAGRLFGSNMNCSE